MTSTPREAENRIGPVGAFLCRLVFLAICLPGPALLAADVLGDLPESAGERWGLLAGGVFTTVVGVGFGLFGWRVVDRSRRDARQLDAAGVAATAEILTVAYHLGGEDPGLLLHLRIHGPGFAAFEADAVRPDDPALVPGALLTAVVDPADRLYRVG
ncbi:hypothetical protein AB0M91_22905 [Micromonospora rifamycinica]|uniref:hypothetical protein n=1 Tax=Micromonospora rifamycinica TaxID=291594 RepID=UPI0033EFA5F2